MNILLLTGVLYPQPSNNANLFSKLIPFLSKEHSVRILALAENNKQEALPAELYGVPVYWIQDVTSWIKKHIFVPAVSKLRDSHGMSDASMEMKVYDNLKRIRHEYCYEVLITTMEPYAYGAAMARLPVQVKKVLYIMDPPAPVIKEFKGSPYRTKVLPTILKKADLILTTPAIASALKANNFITDDSKLSVNGFPIIHNHLFYPTEKDIRMDPERINLLFCGCLYARIRSPEYFLRLVEKLDENFCVYFMGRGCENLFDRHPLHTRAKIICLPQQAYQTALNAMSAADVLINIGNSVSVHMPSKILEYVNTGKSIINFYKLPDCPSLYFTGRYPYCLDISENSDLTESAEAFMQFCKQAKCRPPLDRTTIESLYSDCTPAYIAGQILDYLNR